MKFELKVTFESTLPVTTVIVEYDGSPIGRLELPNAIGQKELAMRERRDAIAGLFLSSLDAAITAARRAHEDKERARP